MSYALHRCDRSKLLFTLNIEFGSMCSLNANAQIDIIYNNYLLLGLTSYRTVIFYVAKINHFYTMTRVLCDQIYEWPLHSGKKIMLQ